MAGLFGANYTKNGPGVSKNEPKKKRFFFFFELYFRKFLNLIELNLIYLLFCIPVITIGPATTAMFYVLRNYSEEKPVFLFSDFWDSFKSNFLQSFVYSIICVGGFALLIWSIFFYIMQLSQGLEFYFLLGFSILGLIIFTFMNYYIFLMIASVNLKLRYIIKNSFLFTFIGMKTNLLTFLFTAPLIFLAAWYYPYTIIPLFLVGFSTLGFIITFNCYKLILKYAVTKESGGEGGENLQEPAGIIEPIFSDELLSTNNKADETEE